MNEPRVQRWLALLLALLPGCGSSEPDDESSPITGHFVAPNPFPSQGFFMSLSIRVTGGTVTGVGWLSGLASPLLPLTVVGGFADPDFSIGLTSGSSSQGSIVGTVTPGGLVGTYTRSGAAPVQLVFARTDTAASGRHLATLSGDVAEALSAEAGFGVLFSHFTLILGYPNRDFPLLSVGWDGGRPAPGLYEMGTTAGFEGQVAPAYAPNQLLFPIIAGSVRIDVSTPHAIIGELQLQTRDAGSGAIAFINAVFSAGCSTQTCP